MRRYEALRQLKDPSALTPYEARIWDLRQQGLTNVQIGAAMKQLPSSIASRMKTIKEKVSLQDALRMVG
jgi:DNA-binding CsgD family transcriptional regulator